MKVPFNMPVCAYSVILLMKSGNVVRVGDYGVDWLLEHAYVEVDGDLVIMTDMGKKVPRQVHVGS